MYYKTAFHCRAKTTTGWKKVDFDILSANMSRNN